MRVNCLGQEHNAVPQLGFEPGSLDPESSALTIRPLTLPTCISREEQSSQASVLITESTDELKEQSSSSSGLFMGYIRHQSKGINNTEYY